MEGEDDGEVNLSEGDWDGDVPTTPGLHTEKESF